MSFEVSPFRFLSDFSSSIETTVFFSGMSGMILFSPITSEHTSYKPSLMSTFSSILSFNSSSESSELMISMASSPWAAFAVDSAAAIYSCNTLMFGDFSYLVREVAFILRMLQSFHSLERVSFTIELFLFNITQYLALKTSFILPSWVFWGFIACLTTSASKSSNSDICSSQLMILCSVSSNE